MPRMILSPRTSDTIELHIGKILIFCEGHTEMNYFDFFKKRIKNKYDNIVIQMENVKSNARAVLNYAEEFLKDDHNSKAFYDYDKYLVFDCDAPDNIAEVIEQAKNSESEYHLLVSSLLFEVWLLMHIEELDGDPLRKKSIAKRIEQHLGLLPDSYEKRKDDQGLIAKIILGYQNVEKAINNAENLRSLYDEKGYEMKDIISGYYPYSNVDELVKQLAKATE